MRRSARMCWSAVGLVLVVAACGDSDEDGSLSAVSSESIMSTPSTAAERSGSADSQIESSVATPDTSAATAVSVAPAATAMEPSSSDELSGGPPVGTGGVASGPAPAEMCNEGEFPIVAAYAIETGEYRWSTCSPEQVWRSMVAATDEAVYLSWYTTTEQTAAFDADDGSDVAVGELPANPDPASSHSPSDNGFVVDGVRIEGGQDVPTRAFDDASGELLWERPGVWVYSDVSAVGDGAVFALERGVRLVGYELDTGEIRWEKPFVDPYSASSWPWHVAGQRLFTLWFNAEVVSTIDGSLLWRTDYPTPTGPGDPPPLRMSGVRANDRTVFVSFSPVGSGGD